MHEKIWDQRFFRWPEDRSKIVHWIVTAGEKRNVYLAPSIFSAPNSRKENWKATNVVWAEIDGKYPSFDAAELPPPSMIIQSGLPNHLHVYWKIEPTTDYTIVEEINRQLIVLMDADASGYDCNQVLRPPLTWNFKRDLPVLPIIVDLDGKAPVFPTEYFKRFPPAPKLIAVPDLTAGGLIPVGSILEKYGISEEWFRDFYQKAEKGDRSTVLMWLGYRLAEVNMEPDEMMSLLYEADEFIGKFRDRQDRWVRLQQIVSIAKNKHPTGILPGFTLIQVQEPNPFTFVDAYDLGEETIEVNFVWDKLLTDQGLLIVSGAPGVGKSQFTMDAIAHMKMGEPYLGLDMSSQKVGYLSLEMGKAALHNIINKQRTKWGEKWKEAGRFPIMPVGEPVDLTIVSNQVALAKQIEKEGLNGIAIDALSSTTLEALSDEKVAKSVLGWIAHLRQNLGVFVWLVHHNRKATAGNERPTRLADVHGAVYIAGQADSILILWKDEKGNLELIPVKSRMSELDNGNNIYTLTRESNLTFTFGAKETPPTKVDGAGPGGKINL